MRKAAITLAILLALVSTWLPSVAANKTTKKLASGVSVYVRTNKRGGKVNLANAPHYSEAVKLFQSKSYGPAARILEDLDRNGYCCDLVHYYIAQCYDNLNQIPRAQLHYQWVAAYSKDRTLRYYASYGYEKLAYYSVHRSYSGQGNNFDRVITGRMVPPPSGGGFG